MGVGKKEGRAVEEIYTWAPGCCHLGEGCRGSVEWEGVVEVLSGLLEVLQSTLL